MALFLIINDIQEMINKIKKFIIVFKLIVNFLLIYLMKEGRKEGTNKNINTKAFIFLSYV